MHSALLIDRTDTTRNDYLHIFQKSNKRILGDRDFVDNVLSKAQEQMKRTYELDVCGVDLDKVVRIVCDLMNIEPEMVFAPGKERVRVQARSLMSYWAVRE